MLQLPVPAQPVVASPVTVGPDPHAQRRLACRYGTLQNDVFIPSVSLDLRVKAAVANGVPEARARIEAALSLMTDEEELRSHGMTWQYLSVRAQHGAGTGEVGGVDSRDEAALLRAELRALALATLDDQGWQALGLSN
ncbi:hypothetical protein Q0M94_25200 (plasmid) [Deinococcus radiomollis]|uniref:hypothetical protein n=1 Tax=Deinococcus radiomollis TaxID=468916 RepID=UPI00389219FD